MKKNPINLLCLFSVAWMLFFPNNSIAQNVDYSQQIESIKIGFQTKSVDGIREMISPELRFPPIPAKQTIPVLAQVFKKFPTLNSLEVKEFRDKYVLLKYSFEGLRGTESALHFDESGKIIRIELIEQAIQKEMELSRSVPQPNPGELGEKYPSKPITFESLDGLKVSGDLYEVNSNYPIILLCHQGMFNKVEYADIAPKLNQLGFNCLAIDQRSGGPFAGHDNETFKKATEKGLSTDFLEAERDIEAAIGYLRKRYKKNVVVWGSSYSSILALFLANNSNVDAAISFSPSNFFKEERPLIENVIKDIKKPYFITSSKRESEKLMKSMQSIKLDVNQIYFIPKTDGFHGSRSLWEGQSGSQEYWAAIEKFLMSIYTSKK